MSRLGVVMIVISAVLVSREPLFAAPPVQAVVQPPAPTSHSAAMPMRYPNQAMPQASRPQPQRVVYDLQLKKGNIFRGRLPDDLLAQWRRKEGIRIRFFDRKNRLIAETRTDRWGQFSLYYLPAGTGTLMVGSGQTAKVCFCRLWTPGTAPPASNNANPRSAGPPSSSVARGQNFHAFPTMSFKEVATVAGVVGGAVGAPLIWHNIQQDHKAPVSGS